MKPLREGEKITANSIKRIRPGFGLPPKFYNDVLGMKVIKDVNVGDRVEWDILKN